jgi:Skp family chaperone for outer membrane proteins
MYRNIPRFLAVLPLVAAFGLTGAAPAAAQAPASPKPAAPAVENIRLGVIDMQFIQREARALRGIRPQIEKLRDGYQAQFKKEDEELRAAVQDLQRQRSILAPEAFDERRRELQKRANDKQRSEQEARQKLEQVIGGAMANVNTALHEVVADVAREKSLHIILQKSTVMLMERRFEITREVLKRLDEKLPVIKVTLPDARPGAAVKSPPN